MRINLVVGTALFAAITVGCVFVLPPGENLDTGVITGTVWLDSNKDGLRDEGESGVPGVRVQLLDKKQKLLIDKGTNVRGEYIFELLDVEDDFFINVKLPNEFELTQAGGDSDVHSEGDNGGLSDLLSELGEAQLVVDAGLVLKE